MKTSLDIIKDSTLTYEQTVMNLARFAENSISPISYTATEKHYLDSLAICDMYEGNAPYRPRYVIVDFEKFIKNGSKFLNLTPPKTLLEATTALMILYRHIPSITSFPVYIGDLDALLEPFLGTEENEESDYQTIKLFLLMIDRMITDSFCHANLGPLPTRAAKLILRATTELDTAIPNLTYKWSESSCDALSLEAITTALKTAKPSFAHHAQFTKDFKGKYAIASCYNGLKIGGGSHTLVRVNLAHAVKHAASKEHFLETILPEVVKATATIMDKRVRFLVEETPFFHTNFLVKEGLISLDNFTAMLGMVGLAECVNTLLNATQQSERFGYSDQANALALEIVQTMNRITQEHHAPYCLGSDNHYVLHAQVGISSDKGISPGCRIPVGEEPEIIEHIIKSSPFHPYFPSGIGDIFVFNQTYEENPQAILDIVKGGFEQGLRYFSLYGANTDVVRISGYLVKRSELKKLDNHDAVLNDATVLGQGGRDNLNSLSRKVR